MTIPVSSEKVIQVYSRRREEVNKPSPQGSSLATVEMKQASLQHIDSILNAARLSDNGLVFLSEQECATLANFQPPNP